MKYLIMKVPISPEMIFTNLTVYQQLGLIVFYWKEAQPIKELNFYGSHVNFYWVKSLFMGHLQQVNGISCVMTF